MKFTLLFTSFLLSVTCMAQRIYVATDGNAAATGTSWTTPQDIFTALDRAQPGDEVYVKAGTYLLPAGADRSASFLIPAGVKVYGSFEGTEADADERTMEVTTTFSGELGDANKDSDNAYSVVVLASDADDYTVLDGFTITNGAGRNFREGLTEGSSGGGLYIMAGQELSTHMIVNCAFEGNRAHNGGAVMVDSGRPSFIGCTFTNNSADFNGGAVYNNGIESEASPIFRDCVFSENSSNSGAGMTNNGTNGSSTPLLLHCQFVDNTSLINGAAIYNITDDNGEAEPIIEGCDFEGNNSILGSDVSDMGVTKTLAVSGGNLAPAAGKTLSPAKGGSLSPTTRR